MRAVYADPPYIGCAHLYPEKEEVDHVALIEKLKTYDAWALSATSNSLHTILPLCSDTVRIMAWVKPFSIFKPSVRTAYAWEPVLVQQGRLRTKGQDTVRDWVSANITLRRGVVGAKPDQFCYWLFEVLNLSPEDEFDDLFPGSGAVTRAWNHYKRSMAFRPEQFELEFAV